MGLCGSKGLSDEEKAMLASSNRFDRVLKDTAQDDAKVVKLLLLGTGESGKSTIFKQMQILYQEGFSDFEKSTFRHVIRRNVVEAMQTLVMGAARFGLAVAPELQAAATFMEQLDPLASDFWQDEVVGHVRRLWKDKAIQETFANRSKLQLLDSTPYLLENVERIGRADYAPSGDDILRARLRTSGIVERMFKINRVDFKFIDVGGQRNERRKWIHCFENVTAVIFVAAISEYDQALHEDPAVNRLREALDVFDGVCNNPFFRHTTVLLFLNKMDLLADKVRRVPLTVCFPDYDGVAELDAVAEYVTQQFLARNKTPKTVFAHLTCATDTKQVEKVFDAAKAAILQGSVRELGCQLA